MDAIELLNTIRDNASEQYQERVPEATRQNIESVGMAITDMDNATTYNEFMNTLINMIYAPMLIRKSWSNPLGKFKKGKKTFGDTIEEVYTNFIKAKTFDQSGAGLLTRELPDTKVVFHRMNRQDKYKLTDSPEALAKAFKSYEGVADYISSLLEAIRNSAELDEYVLMRQLFADAFENNAMVVVNVPDPSASEANAKAFIKAVKTVSGGMTFPNSDYNAYLTAQSVDDKPIITFSRKDEQILIVDNATDVTTNIDVLASAFNKSVVEFNDTQKEIIDAFPVEGVIACLVDKNFFQVYDDLFTFREFENGEGLYRNHILHVWQTIGYSILVNAVAFQIGSDADNDGEVEEFTVTYNLDSDVKSQDKRTTVGEGTIYETKLTGLTSGDAVQVLMGSSDVTATAYNGTKKTVKIASVTGNITINAGENFDVTNSLTTITSSNDATNAVYGSKYEATITGTVATMAISMGGTDITTSAWNGSTKKISIAKVTGDIVITGTGS